MWTQAARVGTAVSVWSATLALVILTLWGAYFSLFWLIGKLFLQNAGMGLIIVAGPFSALAAFALAFYVLVLGGRVATRLDNRFAPNEVESDHQSLS